MLLCLVLSCTLFVGCKTNEKEDKPEETTEAEKAVDYSEYPFAGPFWKRDAEHDTETIHFGEDGSFGYSCGCGNPVNDSDMCEGYTYDDETKTITLECFDESEDMVTVIKVVKCEENELHLDFDGDLRIFTK